jgi:peptidoglycan hydrolase-like protein with peptidoglycan-binding domain
MWQYTSKESVPGKTGASDMSYVTQKFLDLVKPNPKPKVKPSPSILIQSGDKGPEVKKVQQDLISAGEKLPRYGADGHFGNETEQAIKAFQARHGLHVDGIVGKVTLGKLLSSLIHPKKYHTVQKDESLSGIASSNGLSLPEIEKLNPQIRQPDIIHPGDKVRVK